MQIGTGPPHAWNLLESIVKATWASEKAWTLELGVEVPLIPECSAVQNDVQYLELRHKPRDRTPTVRDATLRCPEQKTVREYGGTSSRTTELAYSVHTLTVYCTVVTG